jgi:small subunit ribosomal protein S18
MARGRDRDRDRDRKRTPKDTGKRVKKKICIFCKDHINWVDYKDVNLLRRFMSDRGKIRARRVSGNCVQHQRDVAIAIKTARELALLPYVQRAAAESRGGRGGRGGRPDLLVAPPAVDATAAEAVVAGADVPEIDEIVVDEGASLDDEAVGAAGVPEAVALPEDVEA